MIFCCSVLDGQGADKVKVASLFFSFVTSTIRLLASKRALPKIAALQGSSRRSSALFSSLAATSSAPPCWARRVLPRRYAHDDADASPHHSQYRYGGDNSFGAVYPKFGSTSYHQEETRREATIYDFPVEQHEVVAIDNPPTKYVPDDDAISSLQPPSIAKKLLKNKSADPSSPPVRKPASKTVLNGGLSQRERNERKANFRRIAETVGVKEAEATQRRLEREDDIRKRERKRLLADLRPYIAKQLKLIELEAEEQRKEVETRKGWSLEKLTKEGWALNGMEGYWLQREKKATSTEGALNGKRKAAAFSAIRTAVFHRPGKARIGWTKLQKGDQVELRKAGVHLKDEEAVSSDEADEDLCFATVRSITDTEIRLNFEAHFHDLDLIAHPLWRIDMAYNDLIEQRLKDSVEALLHDIEATKRAGAELSGTRLVEMLLRGGEEAKVKADQWTVARWLEENRSVDVEEEPNYGTLNPTQRQAVDLMLSEPISLIQGPPGTGKTSTIVAAISILKKQYEVPHPILLTAHTNVAVDNLAQGCKDAGLRVVRSGSMVRVRDSLSDVTVEGLMEAHRSKPRLDELEAGKIATIKALQQLQNIDEVGAEENFESRILPSNDLIEGVIDEDVEWLVGTFNNTNGSDAARLQKKLSYLMQKTFVLRREMETSIYKDVDVVCCTALSAPLIKVLDFPIVFFDEATMATEPITIATMIKGCQQLSLIGDQQQLSPLVKSREVIDEGLGLSLFERLMERGDVKSVMLDTQHRMHPTLSEFPNREFYKGRLLDAENTANIAPIMSSYLKQGTHLSFINHNGRECMTKNKSLENNKEAGILVKIIADVLCQNKDVSGSEIGIITPYLGQKELLWKSLQDPTSFHRTLLSNEVTRLGGSKAKLAEVGDIEIHTIDGFEGREKKVILFSLVRANAFKYLGFLKEEKRWNVALTRAKNALIIVGNASMLERGTVGQGQGADEEEQDTFLHRYADHLQEHDCVLSVNEMQK